MIDSQVKFLFDICRTLIAAVGGTAIDRFQRDKRDPSVIVFSEIKRCQHPHFTQFFQKAKKNGKPKPPAGCGRSAGNYDAMWTTTTII